MPWPAIGRIPFWLPVRSGTVQSTAHRAGRRWPPRNISRKNQPERLPVGQGAAAHVLTEIGADSVCAYAHYRAVPHRVNTICGSFAKKVQVRRCSPEPCGAGVGCHRAWRVWSMAGECRLPDCSWLHGLAGGRFIDSAKRFDRLPASLRVLDMIGENLCYPGQDSDAVVANRQLKSPFSEAACPR